MWSIDENPANQRSLRIDGNEEVFHTPQSYRIGAAPSAAV